MKKFPILIGITLAATLALTGCIGDSTPENTAVPTEEPVPTGEPTAVPQPNADDQLAQAQELFPDATAVGDYSKEDVQLALYTAYLYGNASFGDPYYISGQFAADNYPAEYLENNVAPYFTGEGYARFFDAVTLIASGDQGSREEGIKFLIRNLFLVSLSGSDYTAPQGCLDDESSCLSTPLNFTDITYNQANDGSLLVSYRVTGAATYSNSAGNEHIVQREYNVNMTLVRNEAPLVDESYVFLINEIDNSVKGS